MHISDRAAVASTSCQGLNARQETRRLVHRGRTGLLPGGPRRYRACKWLGSADAPCRLSPATVDPRPRGHLAQSKAKEIHLRNEDLRTVLNRLCNLKSQ